MYLDESFMLLYLCHFKDLDVLWQNLPGVCGQQGQRRDDKARDRR